MTSAFQQDFGVTMPPPYKKHHDETGDSSGYSDTEDKQRLTQAENIPKFVKKWFELKKTDKDRLRDLKNGWVAAQKTEGKGNPERDFEGLKMILPKYAAKWFVLPHEEKEKYRTFKNQVKFGDGVPKFAHKWFALSKSQKERYRQLKRMTKSNGKHSSSSSDSEQSDVEGNFQRIGVPKFAAKWFALPNQKKHELRIRYRHGQKCKKDDCAGLNAMMNMLQLQNQAAYPMPPYMTQPYGGQPMPWMGPYFHPGQQHQVMPTPHPAMSSPCMGELPFCLMKQYSPDKQHQPKPNTESSDESDRFRSSCDESAAGNDMPMFVRKWFALPNESRQQLRMLKQYQKKHGKPASAADGIPPFAKKWFGLPEKRKQHWRQINRSQKQQPKFQSPSRASPQDVNVTMAKPADVAGFTTIPDFAEKWFSLPTPRKHHLKLLNKYLQSSDKGSDSSGDEYTEKMPPFAAKWFSLTSQQRGQLRDLKHQSPAKSKSKVKDEASSAFSGYPSGPAPHMYPWQPWAYYGAPQQQQQGVSFGPIPAKPQ